MQCFVSGQVEQLYLSKVEQWDTSIILVSEAEVPRR